MLRTHYLLIGLAVFAIVGLYLLPRSVVNTKERSMSSTETHLNQDSQNHADSDSQHSDDHDNNMESHSVTLTAEQEENLNKYRAAFLEASEFLNKRQAFEKLRQQFRQVGQFDSLIYYAEHLNQDFPSDETLELVGDAHYEAFAFAMNSDKKLQFAEKARTFYDKITEKSPEVQVKIGVTYVTTSSPMQGIRMIREVLNKSPENEFALFSLGNLSMQSGQFEKAIERFEKLISLNPNDLEAQLRLAECYLQTQQPEKALPKLKLVLENTEEPVRKNALQKLVNELEK